MPHCRQWKITAVEGKKDIYTICLFPTHNVPFGGGWSLKDNLAPQGPIISVYEDVEWQIIPIYNGIPDAFLYVDSDLLPFQMIPSHHNSYLALNQLLSLLAV